MTALPPYDHPRLAERMGQALLEPDIAVAAGDPRAQSEPLWPSEAAAVARAVELRQMEYAAGRATIRQAMRRLGVEPSSVPSGDDRAPIWPSGITGSLSHCETACLAAVAHDSEILSLGIDIELAAPLDPELLGLVCTEVEQQWLSALHPRQALFAKVIFSAKESFYKCLYPLAKKIFDFQAVAMSLDIHSAAFSGVLQADIAPFGRGFRLTGRYALSGGLIVTAAILRRADLPTATGEAGQ